MHHYRSCGDREELFRTIRICGGGNGKEEEEEEEAVVVVIEVERFTPVHFVLLLLAVNNGELHLSIAIK